MQVPLRRGSTKYAYVIKKHEPSVCLLGQVLEVRCRARVRVGLSDSGTLDLTEKPGCACVEPPNCVASSNAYSSYSRRTRDTCVRLKKESERRQDVDDLPPIRMTREGKTTADPLRAGRVVGSQNFGNISAAPRTQQRTSVAGIRLGISEFRIFYTRSYLSRSYP
jgi:hypothetical protein